jgi:hypothetical protein
MAMTSVSVMMTVFVLNLHYRGPKKNEIPFWLQQLLSLSLANIARTFSKSRKLKLPCTNRKQTIHKGSSHDINKNQQKQDRTPANGIILSYTNVNETKVKSRITTDVSKANRCLLIYKFELKQKIIKIIILSQLLPNVSFQLFI